MRTTHQLGISTTPQTDPPGTSSLASSTPDARVEWASALVLAAVFLATFVV